MALSLGLEKSSPHYGTIEKIHRFDRSFALDSFIDGAEYAYEMVLKAFWGGDKSTLRNMLSRDVFEQFSGAVDQFEKQNYVHKNTLKDVEKIDLEEASLTGSMAELTLKFTSHMVLLTQDKNGTTVDGHEDTPVKVVDYWTFCRDVKSSDPNWTLVATRNA